MDGSYFCTNCSSNLNFRIICAECDDIQLCLQCFSCGAEIGSHIRSHAYKLVGDFEIFRIHGAKWRARDELDLISAIQRFGYGSWKDISKSIKNEFSAEDTKNHFDKFYIYGNIGRFTSTTRKYLKIVDHTAGFLSSTGCFSTSSDIPSEYQQLLVYYPFRDDYEREFDNEAEALVNDVVFYSSDDDIDRGLKLAQVRMYNDRLKRRFLLKWISKEHNKIHNFITALNKPKPYLYKKKYPKNCRSYEEFREKMQLFIRFYTKSELHHFYECLQREKQLKQKVNALIRLRKLGCRTVDDIKKAKLMYYKLGEKKTKKLSFILSMDDNCFTNNTTNGVKKRRRKKKLKFTQRKRTR